MQSAFWFEEATSAANDYPKCWISLQQVYKSYKYVLPTGIHLQHLGWDWQVYFTLRVVMLSSFAYFINPSFWCFPYFILHTLLSCVKFAMICLIFICKTAKGKENQTDLNESNQIKSKLTMDFSAVAGIRNLYLVMQGPTT